MPTSPCSCTAASWQHPPRGSPQWRHSEPARGHRGCHRPAAGQPSFRAPGRQRHPHCGGVSRGTFYFYFDSKQAVLGELVRRAVPKAMTQPRPGWHPRRPSELLRARIAAGPSYGRPACLSCGPSSRTGAPAPAHRVMAGADPSPHRRHHRPDHRRRVQRDHDPPGGTGARNGCQLGAAWADTSHPCCSLDSLPRSLLPVAGGETWPGSLRPAVPAPLWWANGRSA